VIIPLPLGKLEASGFAVNCLVNLKCLQLSSSFFVLASLMTSCGYPLKSEPFLNGRLEVVLTTCPIDEPCDIQPATLTIQATKIESFQYTFSGTIEANSERFTLEGTESSDSREDLAYLTPKARGIFASIEAVLSTSVGGNYASNGSIIYGSAGGISPYRMSPPWGNIYATPKPGCLETQCPYRELNIEFPAQVTP
jgi:hypothetical protein